MKGLANIVTVLLISLSVPVSLTAQKSNEVTMPVQLSLPPTASISLAGPDVRLSMTEGKGAEQIITPSTVGKIWINYSSIVAWNTSNTICVSLSSGDLPAEVVIKLNVGPDLGAGSGKVGHSVGQVTLTNYPQAIITGIGSCYTGQGTNKGHLLTFSWSLRPDVDSDILSLKDLELEVGLIYTIIADE